MGFWSSAVKAVEAVGKAISNAVLGGPVNNSVNDRLGQTYPSVTQTNNSNGNNGNNGNAVVAPPSPVPIASVPTQVLTPIHFVVSCTGLKPDTVHNFYYEGIDVTNYCTQFGAAQGSTTLKTDNSGSIKFDFNFTTNVEKYVDGLNKVGYDLAGDKKFELRATGSSASKIIPFKY